MPLYTTLHLLNVLVQIANKAGFYPKEEVNQSANINTFSLIEYGFVVKYLNY
jgi:hypothetical protein